MNRASDYTRNRLWNHIVSGKLSRLLYAISLIIILSCNEKGWAPTLLPVLFLSRSPGVYLDYAKQSLIDKANSVPDTNFNGTVSHPFNAWPHIEEHEGSLCIYALQPFYHNREKGLRLVYCSNISYNRKQILSVLDEFYSHDYQTAYPHYKEHRIVLSAVSADPERFENDSIISMDGSPDSRMSREAPFSGTEQNFVYNGSRMPYPPDRISLPRRFPRAWYHLRVGVDYIELLYPLTDTLHLMSIKINDPGAADRVLTALRTLPSIRNKLIRNSRDSTLFVSEIAFARHTGSGREVLELGSGTEDGYVSWKLNTDESSTLAGRIFLFSRSTLLFRGGIDLDFRLKDQLIAGLSGDSVKIDASDFDDRGATDSRTLSQNEDYQLAPSFKCITGDLCGSVGIHPYYIPEVDFDSHDCSASDISLKEFNPFGVYSEGSSSLDPGGKFIEFMVNRDCRSSFLIIAFDDGSLDLPQRDLHSGERFFYSADRNLFSTPGTEDTNLRSLTEDDTISIIDARSGQRKILYEPDLNGNRLRIPGSKGEESENIFRVHSLVVSPDNQVRFHGGESIGLRPDLLHTHSMSPGHPENRFIPSSTFLSEVSPLGSTSEDLSSNPGDEFFEIYVNPPAIENPALAVESSSLELEIERLSDGEVKVYEFPVPSGPGYFTIVRNTPVCWEAHSIDSIFSSLSLPNEPAKYTLKPSHGPVTSVNIDAMTFSSMKNDPRKTIQYIKQANIWRITDISSGNNLCTSTTNASPGEYANFNPFYIIEDRTSSRIRFRRYAMNEVENITAVFERNPGENIGSTILTQDSEGFYTVDVSSLPYHRILIFIEDALTYPAGNAIKYLAEAFPLDRPFRVDTVSPTPSTYEYEYIRLCSPDGFSLTSFPQGIYVRDSLSSDRIVPWAMRFPGSDPVPGLDPSKENLLSGECMVVIDPDYTGDSYTIRNEDRSIWTVESGSALGDGLSSGESITIFTPGIGGLERPLAGYSSLPAPEWFSIDTLTGQRIERIPGLEYDERESYEVRQ